jgi:hypothetical protein
LAFASVLVLNFFVMTCGSDGLLRGVIPAL